jgi:hypothetical protein
MSERTTSGRIEGLISAMFRLPPEVKEYIKTQAKKKKISINQEVTERLQRTIVMDMENEEHQDPISLLKRKIDKQMIALNEIKTILNDNPFLKRTFLLNQTLSNNDEKSIKHFKEYLDTLENHEKDLFLSVFEYAKESGENLLNILTKNIFKNCQENDHIK